MWASLIKTTNPTILKSIKKGTKVADFDPKLKPVLMKNVLDNKKVT